MIKICENSAGFWGLGKIQRYRKIHYSGRIAAGSRLVAVRHEYAMSLQRGWSNCSWTIQGNERNMISQFVCFSFGEWGISTTPWSCFNDRFSQHAMVWRIFPFWLGQYLYQTPTSHGWWPCLPLFTCGFTLRSPGEQESRCFLKTAAEPQLCWWKIHLLLFWIHPWSPA